MDKKNLLQMLKYAVFSVSAGLIEILSFTLLNEIFHLNAWMAHLIALILSVLWNFTLNRKYTFQSAANVPIAMLKVAAFYLIFTPLSTWWTAALTEESYGICWNAYLVEFLTMCANFVLEFLYFKFVVFKGKDEKTQK